MEITQYHQCSSDLYWKGCYGDGCFNQYFDNSTYAHPAKISPLLVDRIFKHLESLELLKDGMTILDFMAGSGRIPLLASIRGYKSIGVELEPHFVKMCNDNKKFAENKIGRKLDMEIIQGDSRQLSKILKSSDVGICSPPYEEAITRIRKSGSNQLLKDLKMNNLDGQAGYGSSEGNIGNLPYVAVVSPPYQDSISSKKHGIDESKINPKYSGGGPHSQQKIPLNYSQNPNNIGNLKDNGIVAITSPPYYEIQNQSGGLLNKNRKDLEPYIWVKRNHGETDGQISNLKDTSFVGITSPPYENQTLTQDIEFIKKIENQHRKGSRFQGGNLDGYGVNEQNLGNQQGENYLSAMLQVYREASKVCPVIVTVTKNPTRTGKLRRLDLDTAKLLELSGYKVIDYHRAVLFKTINQSTFGGVAKKEYKGRISFFKRLSLSRGNKAASFEDVIIGVKA